MEMDKLSYALGISFGQQITQANLQISDFQAFAKGMEVSIKGTAPEIDFAECQQVLNDYFSNIQEEETRKMNAVRKEGEDFLSENGKRPEVKTTASGLQYEVIKEGTGKRPTVNDVVKVHYHGTLIDGTVFDSSVKRGTPAEFGVSQVIKGWVEALQLMPVGSKYKLYIPAELAYGQQGAGAMIKPNSALVFEVELLEIK